MAQLCALTANINRDAKKRSEPFGLTDFMLFDRKPEEETPVEGAKVDPMLLVWMRAVSAK